MIDHQNSKQFIFFNERIDCSLQYPLQLEIICGGEVQLQQIKHS